MSYSSFKIILIHVKNIIPIITATLILNYLNNSERSLVKQILIEDEIIVCATYLKKYLPSGLSQHCSAPRQRWRI